MANIQNNNYFIGNRKSDGKLLLFTPHNTKGDFIIITESSQILIGLCSAMGIKEQIKAKEMSLQEIYDLCKKENIQGIMHCEGMDIKLYNLKEIQNIIEV